MHRRHIWPKRLGRLQEKITCVKFQNVVQAARSLIFLAYFTSVLVVKRTIMKPQLEALILRPHHELQNLKFTASNRQPAGISVVIHDVKRRVFEHKAAPLKLRPVAKRKTKLKQIDAVNANLIKRAQQLLHVRTRAWHNRHFNHYAGDILLGHAHCLKHAHLHFWGVIILNAEADFRQASIAQRARRGLIKQVT